MDIKRCFWLVLITLVTLLLGGVAYASLDSYFMDRMNFPSGESRVHNHTFTFSGTLKLVKPSEFSIVSSTGSPSVSGDDIEWSSASSADVELVLSSPSSCVEGMTYESEIYFNGSKIDEFTYVCMPDNKVRDYKVEYGHGDGNYLSEDFIGEDSVTLFNLMRVWNLGHYMMPDEDAVNASMRCYFENFTARTHGHGELWYNNTRDPIMDFFWSYITGGYWFRIGVLSQDFNGLPVGDSYNVTCDEFTYLVGNEMVRVPGFNYSLEVRSCDALQMSVSNYSADLTKAQVTVTNREKYTLNDLYFVKLVDGFSEEQHIIKLLPNESANFFVDRSDGYEFTFYFIPSWYHSSLKPQYCVQKIDSGESPPSVDIIAPRDGSVYSLNGSVLIEVEVTDGSGVDTVIARIQVPGNGVENITLTDGDGDSIFTGNFSDHNVSGTYYMRIFANDTSGNVNDAVRSYFSLSELSGTYTNIETYNYDYSHHGGDDDVTYEVTVYNITNVSNIYNQNNYTTVEGDSDWRYSGGSWECPACVDKFENYTSPGQGLGVRMVDSPISFNYTDVGLEFTVEVMNTGNADLNDVRVKPIMPAPLMKFLKNPEALLGALGSGDAEQVSFDMVLDLCNNETPSLASFPFSDVPFLVQVESEGAVGFTNVTVPLDLPFFTVATADDLYYEGDTMKVCFVINNFHRDVRPELGIEFELYDGETAYLADFLREYIAQPDELLIVSKEYDLSHIPKTQEYSVSAQLYENGTLTDRPVYLAQAEDTVELVDNLPLLELPSIPLLSSVFTMGACGVAYLPVILFIIIVIIVTFIITKREGDDERPICVRRSFAFISLAILLLLYYLFICPDRLLLFIVILLLIYPLVCLLRWLFARVLPKEYENFCEEMDMYLKNKKDKKYHLKMCHVYKPFVDVAKKVPKKVSPKSSPAYQTAKDRIERVQSSLADRAEKLKSRKGPSKRDRLRKEMAKRIVDNHKKGR